MSSYSSPSGTLVLKWDPKNLEIRTKSVEKTLEPLVTQVTTLVNQKGPSKKKKGRSKKAQVLSAAVEGATDHFIEKGEEIANENQDIRADMMVAVDDVKKTGAEMKRCSQEFADDPCSSMKRGAMVRAARALLSSVTRLLVLADMVDIHLLMKSLNLVEGDLDRIRNAANQQDLLASFQDYDRSMLELSDLARRRQMDLKDPRHRDDIAAARATLKKNNVMLLTSSKAYVRHPELAEARHNRDYVLKQVCDAVNTISGVAQSTGVMDNHPYEGAGELASALDEFDQKLIMDPLQYNEVRTRPSLEERLESIISGAALMADSGCTRDDRRERIVNECKSVRQALQDLLSEYMSNMGKSEPSNNLDRAVENMYRKTRDLRRQLRKAVVDHVSDTFLETNVPLLMLIDAAKSGNEKDVDEYANMFTEHANKLVEVANLVCSMSNNLEGVKLVRMVAAEVEQLCPQVVNAARVLAARPKSKVALENMEVFKENWQRQVRLLTETVDDITTIDDFLAVSEGHILEDVNKCVAALQAHDPDSLDRTAGAIRGRSARVCNVVSAEMQNFAPGPYTERVMEAVYVLREQIMPNFANKVEEVVDQLGAQQSTDNDAFINASRLVYDGVCDIRRTVMLNRSPDEMESDPEVEYEDEQQTRSVTDQDDRAYEHQNDRAMMLKLPAEDRAKIQQQVEIFRMEKAKLDREIDRWDDSGNDIIVISKQMCMIMMEMTDFTRGRGPLRNTMDVINAAKKISEAGAKLDKLCKDIAEQCPDSSSKKDLMAYLQRIALYCHQLNITSKVKADVQNLSGELIVSGLDSATSLIQAAKNLMNAVVLSVKASYVASTKYTRQLNTNAPVVMWKMKMPEKKPLVRKENPDDLITNVHKSAKNKNVEPIKALSEFHS